jgi:hypothetical protein
MTERLANAKVENMWKEVDMHYLKVNPSISLEVLTNSTKVFIQMSEVEADIRTKHLKNTSKNCYRLNHFVRLNTVACRPVAK